MPAQEKIQAASRRTNRIPRPGKTRLVSRQHLVHRLMALQCGVVLLWLAVIMVLITVALVSSRGGSQGA